MSPNDVTVGSIVQVDPAWTERGFGGCLMIVAGIEAPKGLLVGFFSAPGSRGIYTEVPIDKVETTGGHVVWTTDAMNHGGEDAHG